MDELSVKKVRAMARKLVTLVNGAYPSHAKVDYAISDPSGGAEAGTMYIRVRRLSVEPRQGLRGVDMVVETSADNESYVLASVKTASRTSGGDMEPFKDACMAAVTAHIGEILPESALVIKEVKVVERGT